MDSSLWKEETYRTHFFCALCGGPFARVYRTDEPSTGQDPDREQSSDESGHRAYRHTILRSLNHHLSAEELAKNAYVSGELEIPQAGSDGEPGGPSGHLFDAPVWRAYDGREISEEEMTWTQTIRALIHRKASRHPEGALDELHEGQDVYLTGLGRVAENGSWAAAYSSLQAQYPPEDDDEDADQDPDLDDSHLNLSELAYGFHLYQESDRNDRRFCMNSIPFHSECWDIFIMALQTSRTARGLAPYRPDEFPYLYDPIWSYLCEMLPAALPGKRSDLRMTSLIDGTAEDPITRLSTGCMGSRGYREAEQSGSGRTWLHLEGLHVGEVLDHMGSL